MGGIKDYELYVRWLQFGVFSPINRLHSNSSPFCGKEPWRYPAPYEGIAEETLRLRHRLLPYIYTMNYQCHEDLKPAVVPIYYHCPMEREAYKYKNEYFFGSELLVIPMVHPSDRETGYTTETAWIPAGVWTDFFWGQIYNGGSRGRHGTFSRPVNRQCVLAKAGAIVPMGVPSDGEHSVENPETLEILVFPGADNSYVLYEDEGDGFGFEEGRFAKTQMKLSWTNERAVFTLIPEGDLSVLPKKRRYILRFRGFRNLEKIQAGENWESSYDGRTRTLSLIFTGEQPERTLTVELIAEPGKGLMAEQDDLKERVFKLLDGIQGSIGMKTMLYQCFEKDGKPQEILSDLHSLCPSASLENILMEMLECI